MLFARFGFSHANLGDFRGRIGHRRDGQAVSLGALLEEGTAGEDGCVPAGNMRELFTPGGIPQCPDARIAA